MIINRAPSLQAAEGAWERFRSACHRFLVSQPEWIGWIQADEAVDGLMERLKELARRQQQELDEDPALTARAEAGGPALLIRSPEEIDGLRPADVEGRVAFVDYAAIDPSQMGKKQAAQNLSKLLAKRPVGLVLVTHFSNQPRESHGTFVGDGSAFDEVKATWAPLTLYARLEDMAPAEQGDQLGGCSVEVARAAVLELVGLQAPSWCDESLKQYDWLYTLQEPELTTQMLYSQLLPGFLERYGDRLEADERDIIARVGESPECPLFVPAETPFCLEHVDYRLDNMLIDATHSPPKVTVVDWQSLRLGPPMNDVAYFLGAGMLPEDRRGAEEDIVRAYHQALTGAGVEGYGWDACWTDYRKGSFSGFGVTVIASMIVQQTERGDEMFTVMARRHARHALDVGAEEFLG